ncbi:hypothetical protein EZJ55_18875 [Microcystis aeruginosa EAWAG127a]|jgi:hypothetical protein|uniref:Uncharacterized protein n=1 Tax=Microcystis aeruginosa EAWAG127a TaxID=2529855 RepID=A0A5J5LX69_MICAE|nr:hypothetical protein EZJ55_18875 [Microcystis aeruginosa EAWAG127a]
MKCNTKSVEYRLVMRRGTHARGKRQREINNQFLITRFSIIVRMLRPHRMRSPLKMPGFEARFSQNLAPVSQEKPQNPYLAYISHLFLDFPVDKRP